MSSIQYHQCPVCSQRFSRNEHLQRHKLTHYEQNNRPYQCNICYETFSRRFVICRQRMLIYRKCTEWGSDVLKRHETTQHPDGNNENPIAGPRKSRATLACDRCARVKLRCDGLTPCGRCKSRNHDCTLYRSHSLLKRRQPPPRSRISQPAIEETEAQIPTSQDANYDRHARHQANGGWESLDSALETGGSTLVINEVDNVQLFDPMSSSFGSVFDFPNDLWLQGPSPPFSNMLGAESTQSLRRLKSAPPTEHDTSPYASCPLDHRLEKNSEDTRTSRIAIMSVCDFLQDRTCWKEIREMSRNQICAKSQPVASIDEQSRDALVAITHITLSEARKSVGIHSFPLKFPPLDTLQCLFDSCLTRFGRLYPMIHPKSFEMTLEGENEGDTYPVFLQNVMVLGAMLLAIRESQSFANVLAYLVRKAMNDIIAQDVRITNDVWMLSSAILITVTGAWSGDKVHVETAEAYRGSYTVMFNRRGYFKPQPDDYQNDEIGSEWSKWIARERNRRLCHVWYIVEQEISFFNSITSHISFTDMRSQMPGPDKEFFAATETEWAAIRAARNRISSETKPVRLQSLAAFYWLFTRDNFMHLDVEVTPFQLRLLQCAIQTEVVQHSQSARFVNIEDAFAGIPTGSSMSSQSTISAQLRVEEIQNHLVKWYIISKRLFAFEFTSETSVACYLMHHLISMELYICFNDVQCLAGKDGLRVGKALIPHFQQWARSSASLKAIAHAGQIIKILQTSTPNRYHDVLRPIWWPVALARAALVLWSYAIANHITGGKATEANGSGQDAVNLIPINSTFNDSGPYGKVIQLGEGEPCVVDILGTQIPIMDISDVLDLILVILEDRVSKSTPLCASIQRFISDVQRCGIPY